MHMYISQVPLLCKEGLGEVEFSDIQQWFWKNRKYFHKISCISVGPLAQLVEQLTLNQRAVGSTPTRPTIFIPTSRPTPIQYETTLLLEERWK